MKNNIKYLFLFVLFFLLNSNVVKAEDTMHWCINNNYYLFENSGKGELVDFTRITEEEANRGSILPEEYYSMKNDLDNAIENKWFSVNTLNLYLRGVTDYYKLDENFNYEVFNNFLNNYVNNREDTFTDYLSIYSGGTEGKYEFKKATSLNQRCTISTNNNGTYVASACPLSVPEGTKDLYNGKSVVFNEARGKFDVTFKNTTDTKLILRIIHKKINQNKESYSLEYVKNNLYEEGSIFVELAPSQSITYRYDKNVTIIAEYYLTDNSDGCGGSFLGGDSFRTPSYAYVTTSWYNKSVCTNFKNDSKYEKIPKSSKQFFVPECYKGYEYDFFTSQINENSIKKNIENVVALYSTDKDTKVGTSINQQCVYRDNTKEKQGTSSTITYIYGKGEYWAASCEETVVVQYDDPKKVKAGTGFDYETTVTVSRVCTPFLLKKAKQLEKCEYDVSCWYGPANHKGESGAGPNEDFDSCVNTCDGGKYTKDCINKCYASVYEKKTYTSVSFMNVVKEKQSTIGSSNALKIKSQRIDGSYAETKSCSVRYYDTPNSCYYNDTNKNNKEWWGKESTISGTAAYSISDYNKTPDGRYIYDLAADISCKNGWYCHTLHNQQFVYLPSCDDPNNPTKCYEVYESKPRPYCSDNPDEYGYISSTTKSEIKDEYNSLIKKLGEYTKTENFSMTVVDSYLTENNNLKKTKFVKENNNSELTGILTVDTTSKKEVQKLEDLYFVENSNDKSDSVTNQRVTVSKTYTINLPYAYINKLTSDASYSNSKSSSDKNEIAGGNMYYTSLKSGTYNNFNSWNDGYSPKTTNTKPTVRVGNNIQVVINNVGTLQSVENNAKTYTWSSINIDCFYGLINEFIDLDCDDNICDNGLQHMFRQVNLLDLFPDRDARYNWRATVKVGTEYIDATEITEQIEKTGNDVYNQEPEYEFTITKNNIRNIRSYNKNKSYQDYPDMSCSTLNSSGIQTCISGFMSNDIYISSLRNDEFSNNRGKGGN